MSDFELSGGSGAWLHNADFSGIHDVLGTLANWAGKIPETLIKGVAALGNSYYEAGPSASIGKAIGVIPANLPRSTQEAIETGLPASTPVFNVISPVLWAGTAYDAGAKLLGSDREVWFPWSGKQPGLFGDTGTGQFFNFLGDTYVLGKMMEPNSERAYVTLPLLKTYHPYDLINHVLYSDSSPYMRMVYDRRTGKPFDINSLDFDKNVYFIHGTSDAGMNGILLKGMTNGPVGVDLTGTVTLGSRLALLDRIAEMETSRYKNLAILEYPKNAGYLGKITMASANEPYIDFLPADLSLRPEFISNFLTLEEGLPVVPREFTIPKYRDAVAGEIFPTTAISSNLPSFSSFINDFSLRNILKVGTAHNFELPFKKKSIWRTIQDNRKEPKATWWKKIFKPNSPEVLRSKVDPEVNYGDLRWANGARERFEKNGSLLIDDYDAEIIRDYDAVIERARNPALGTDLIDAALNKIFLTKEKTPERSAAIDALNVVVNDLIDKGTNKSAIADYVTLVSERKSLECGFGIPGLFAFSPKRAKKIHLYAIDTHEKEHVTHNTKEELRDFAKSFGKTPNDVTFEDLGFDFSKSSEKIQNYMSHDYFSELLARGSLLKDWFGISKDDPLTPEMLRYAKQYYKYSEYLDNHLSEMLNSIVDFDRAAAWLSRARVVSPILGGAYLLNNAFDDIDYSDDY